MQWKQIGNAIYNKQHFLHRNEPQLENAKDESELLDAKETKEVAETSNQDATAVAESNENKSWFGPAYMDFAGSGIVHMVGGVAGLAVSSDVVM